jgi:hypothetical protein
MQYLWVSHTILTADPPNGQIETPRNNSKRQTNTLNAPSLLENFRRAKKNSQSDCTCNKNKPKLLRIVIPFHKRQSEMLPQSRKTKATSAGCINLIMVVLTANNSKFIHPATINFVDLHLKTNNTHKKGKRSLKK